MKPLTRPGVRLSFTCSDKRQHPPTKVGYCPNGEWPVYGTRAVPADVTDTRALFTCTRCGRQARLTPGFLAEINRSFPDRTFDLSYLP